MIIDGREYQNIAIVDGTDKVFAVISDRDIIVYNGFQVIPDAMLVPPEKPGQGIRAIGIPVKQRRKKHG